MALHRTLGQSENHPAHSLEYANAAARTAAVLVSADIGRIARQLDDGTFWVLMNHSPLTWGDLINAGDVPSTRQVIAGAGLTGGGDLTADRTINAVAHADGSIVVNANDIQVGVLAVDGQHGARGGGTQHAVATPSVAGFMSAADKTKLNDIPIVATIALEDGPGDSAVSGAYREVLGGVFPSSITWYTDVTKVAKIIEHIYTRDAGQKVTTSQTKIYADDGVTVAVTLTDAITYSGAWETSRTRSVA